MGTAPKGEGRPRRRKDGTWVQWVDLGYRDGKRLRKKVESKDRDTVKRKVVELRRRITAGADVTKKPPTVAELLDRYLDTHDGRPRTVASYRYVARDFLAPHIGAMLAPALTSGRVRDLFNTLRHTQVRPRGKRHAEPEPNAPTLSTDTLLLCRTVLHGAYAMVMADGDGLIVRNPVDGIKAPKALKPRRKAKAIEPTRIGPLLQALAGNRLELAVKLCLLGLRRSEVAGLRLQDFDAETGMLTIAGQLGYLAGKGLQWAEPKSEDGSRAFKLPSLVHAELVFYLRLRMAEQQANGWADSPYLFRGVTRGQPLNSGAIYTAFKEAAATVGLGEYRLHDCRHTYISYLADQGLPPPMIQAIAGHATIAQTLEYMHQLPGQTERAAAIADQLFRQAAGGE